MCSLQCDGCGAAVDEKGLHGFSKGCHSPCCSSALLTPPRYPEPTGLYRKDGKRQHGATVEGWQVAGVGRHLCIHSSPLTQTGGI